MPGLIVCMLMPRSCRPTWPNSLTYRNSVCAVAAELRNRAAQLRHDERVHADDLRATADIILRGQRVGQTARVAASRGLTLTAGRATIEIRSFSLVPTMWASSAVGSAHEWHS